MSSTSLLKNECSRIFRPWDSDQDSTISSSCSGDDNLVYKSEKCSQSDVFVKSEYENNTDFRVKDTQSLNTKSTSITPVTQVKLDSSAYEPNLNLMDYNILSQNMYMNPAYTDYMQFPYIGIDPYTIEQEYYRVLSEEAHAKLTTAKKERPKKFKCPHCDVAFSNNGQLKGHIRIHTGNISFKKL